MLEKIWSFISAEHTELFNFKLQLFSLFVRWKGSHFLALAFLLGFEWISAYHRTIAFDRANLIKCTWGMFSITTLVRIRTFICVFTFIITLFLSNTLVNTIFVDNFFYSVPFNISYQHFELIKFNANTCYALIQKFLFFGINFHSKCITMAVIQLQFFPFRLSLFI